MDEFSPAQAGIKSRSAALKSSEDSANSRPFSPDVVYPSRSIQTGGGSWAGRGNLAKDPGEKVNLYRKRDLKAATLRMLLSEYEAEAKALREELDTPDDEKASVSPNPIDTDMLKALGYIE